MAGEIYTRWGSQQTITVSLASLASDTNLLAGRASSVIDFSALNAEDFHIYGQTTTGTSPTASRAIEVWMYYQIADTPTYIDGITGSDANKTMTSLNVKNNMRRAASILTDSASDRAYSWHFSVASLFGGLLPKRGGLFIAHNTGVNFNATAGNHFAYGMPVYRQVQS